KSEPGSGGPRGILGSIQNAGRIAIDQSTSMGGSGAILDNNGFIQVQGGTLAANGASFLNRADGFITGLGTLDTSGVGAFTNNGTVDLASPSVLDILPGTSGVAVTFASSADMNAATVTNAANYLLTASGRDGVFGNGNDVNLAAHILGIRYDATSKVATIQLDSPLPTDVLRLTFKGDSILDANGTKVFDGNFSRRFLPPGVQILGLDQSVTVAENSSVGGTLTGFTQDYVSPTFAIDTAPARGTAAVSDANTGAFAYTPLPYFNGGDQFTFLPTAAWYSSAPGTVDVTVTPVDYPPVAGPVTASTTDQHAIVIPVLQGVTDPDPEDSVRIVAIGTPSVGIAAITENGTTVTYTPNANQHGSVTFSYVVQDSGGMQATSTITVNVTDVTAPSVVDVLVEFGSQHVSIMNLSRTLPWFNIRAIDVVFSEDVDLVAQALSLTGRNVSRYGFSGFDYNAASATAKWQLSNPLDVDRILMDLGGTSSLAVRDLAGNSLTGGDFRKTLLVLPGDVNGDGAVTAGDMIVARNSIGVTVLDPSLFADVNGDGKVDIADYNLVRTRIGRRLPR
uniref:Ig-like domain-containing protein n=1 Tax=Aquisphaera insulae TaxID=2712864 RepID=UPI0013ECB953